MFGIDDRMGSSIGVKGDGRLQLLKKPCMV